MTDGLCTFGEYALEKNATRKTKEMERHSFFPVHNTTQKNAVSFHIRPSPGQAVCLTYSSDSGQRTKEDKAIYMVFSPPSGEAECGAIVVNFAPCLGNDYGFILAPPAVILATLIPSRIMDIKKWGLTDRPATDSHDGERRRRLRTG